MAIIFSHPQAVREYLKKWRPKVVPDKIIGSNWTIKGECHKR